MMTAKRRCIEQRGMGPGELLKTGAILDATSHHGTALSWAVNGGHNAVVRLLLKKMQILRSKEVEVRGEEPHCRWRPRGVMNRQRYSY